MEAIHYGCKVLAAWLEGKQRGVLSRTTLGSEKNFYIRSFPNQSHFAGFHFSP